MRTVIISVPDSIGLTASIRDAATGKEINGVRLVEFDELNSDLEWGGTLHFIQRSGREPEDVILKTPEIS